MGTVVLLRHGETAWSKAGRHTSHTDVDLTPAGEDQARALAGALAGWRFTAVVSSPRRRALHTAALARLTVSAVDDDLAEWDYGRYESLTTAQIRQQRPGWDLWSDGCPAGESPAQLAIRLDRCLANIRPLLADGDVALVGHGHALRVAAARWADLPASAGSRLLLDTATLSTLGFEHDRRVILTWNRPVR